MAEISFELYNNQLVQQLVGDRKSTRLNSSHR